MLVKKPFACIHAQRVSVFGVALLLSVLFLGVMVPAYAEEYVFILKWGSQGSGDGQFDHPIGVAVDASGNVYVADTGSDRVQKFGPFALTIESSDVAGNVKNVFDIPGIMYVNGSGYSASTTYDLYIVEDQATWTDGMTIPTRVPGTATNVTSDASENIPPSAVWSPPLTPGNYDIVVDVNGNGQYDVGVDALDDSDIQTTAGFNVILEFPAEEVLFWMQWWLWAIVAVVIIALAGALYFLKKRKPPTPTAPTLPIEGTPENTTQNTKMLNSYLPPLFIISISS